MKLQHGCCLEKLKSHKSDSVDSLITDPPAGISFMGKDWDGDKGDRDTWILWLRTIMKECYRVMKPGAHGLVWAIPRTSHWTATALEDAGFEIRDVVTHLFGSGFPKSLNIGKQIKEYEGWGTALKPASEHWILIRKPCSEKTVAKNVLKWGVGGINIDGCRIEANWSTDPNKRGFQGGNNGANTFSGNRIGVAGNKNPPNLQGRFPANLVLDEVAAGMLDEQSGVLTPQGSRKLKDKPSATFAGGSKDSSFFGDKGGASRFFYVAKASKKDRNEGLEGMPYPIKTGSGNLRNTLNQNFHPTVKSTKLMEYLITLITPPNGIVLDPFMGSGSTGVAAKRLGFKFIGIEKEKEYFEIAEKRMAK